MIIHRPEINWDAVIRNIKDDNFVSTIVKMARSKSGMQYFPFLDNICKRQNNS